MEHSIARRHVSEARVGHLATVTPDSRPHVVPCCFALQGDTVYSAIDGKPKTTIALARLTNVRANAAASLLVDHYDDDWSQLWWIRLDGTARVLDSGVEYEEALDLLTAKYEQYRETRPPGPVIALDVDRWRSWP